MSAKAPVLEATYLRDSPLADGGHGDLSLALGTVSSFGTGRVTELSGARPGILDLLKQKGQRRSQKER